MKMILISLVLFIVISKCNGQIFDSYFNNGTAKSKNGDYKGAIADYDKAIELNPDYADAYLNRGNSKRLLNDKKGSCQDFIKAGKLGSAEAYDSIKKNCN